jgi:pimeloyl-ACP methyl ester carboxylesterase
MTFAVFPQRGAPVSLASWAREMADVARATIAPPPFPDDAARGEGQPVIVLPGFFTHDVATARLRDFLSAQGFAPRPWPCGMNLGPMPKVLAQVERQVADTAERHGKVALVGISLGGTIAREIAHRRPGQISRVITLGSPIRLPVISPLAPFAHATSLLWEPEARATFARIAQALPVPLTAVVSPIDGIVDWRCCLPEPGEGEVVEVANGHSTMASSPEVQRIVADRLARDNTGAMP